MKCSRSGTGQPIRRKKSVVFAPQQDTTALQRQLQELKEQNEKLKASVKTVVKGTFEEEAKLKSKFEQEKTKEVHEVETQFNELLTRQKSYNDTLSKKNMELMTQMIDMKKQLEEIEQEKNKEKETVELIQKIQDNEKKIKSITKKNIQKKKVSEVEMKMTRLSQGKPALKHTNSLKKAIKHHHSGRPELSKPSLSHNTDE